MSNDEIESERNNKAWWGVLAVIMFILGTIAIIVKATYIPTYRVSYSAESKTLAIKGPNGNRIDIVGFIESTNTPMYVMYNVGFLRQYQHEAVAEFVTDVMAVAAMNPVCDTNSALAVSEAFFSVANKRNAAAIRDAEDFNKGRIHD